MHVRAFLLVLLTTLSGVVRAADNTEALQQAQAAQTALDERVAALILQLGHDDYAMREKAQAEIERLGLAAFDALDEARNHEDIEIKLRARYLLRSMRVNWSIDSDAPEIKKILLKYGEKSDAERKNLMDQLANLQTIGGATALCRLVRFETSLPIAKRAALLVMNFDLPEERQVRADFSVSITNTIGLSKRDPSIWLKTYAKTILNGDSTIENWLDIVRREEQTFTQFPDKSSQQIVRDLIRWNAELLWSLDHDDQAIEMVRRTVAFIDGTPEQLMESMDWLLDRKAWSVVDEVAERFPEPFRQNSLLIYLLAESQLKRGNTELAEQTADQAVALDPEEHEPHIEAGESLQERGLMKWAEREYRVVMKLGPAGSVHDLRARFRLSEMLHDDGQELPAAEVLQGAVDAMEDPNVLQLVERLNRDPGGVRSRMHYFFARHLIESGELQKAREHLETGIKQDPLDADVLIAMYRLPETDEQWKAMTKKYITDAVRQFRSQIAENDEEMRQASEPTIQYWHKIQLASANNQLAWLVGNTEGNYDEALRCSQRSLVLLPDTAGYLDTLGRCYYAKGDLENALAAQQRAVDLEPYSGQIRKQLELFQQAAAAAKNEQAEGSEEQRDASGD